MSFRLQLVILFILMLVVYLLYGVNSISSYANGGIFLSLWELALYAAALFKCAYLYKQQEKRIAKYSLCFLFVFFFFCSLGDLIWHSAYYAKILGKVDLFIASSVNFNFAIAFIAGGTFLNSRLGLSQGIFRAQYRFSIFVGFVSSLVFALYFWESLNWNAQSFLFVSRTVYIGTNAFISCNLMSIYLMSRSNFWTFFSAGLLTMFSIGAEIVLKESQGIVLDFDFYEFIYAYGLSLSVSSLLFVREIQIISEFTLRSIQVQLKIALLFFITGTVVLLTLFTNSIVPTDRFISFGVISSMGLILSALFTQYVYEKIIKLNQIVGDIFVREIEGRQGYDDDHLPFVELHEVIDISFSNRLSIVSKSLESEQKLNQAQNLRRVALQVSHDIRSPLGALKMSIRMLDIDDSETSSMINQGLAQINDIANNLLLQGREKVNIKKFETLPITDILEMVVSEKNIEKKESADNRVIYNINPDHSNLFVKVIVSDFRSILSNLINNSLEASSTLVEIKLSISSEQEVIIKVSDNGCGMSAEVLSKLGKEEVTQGKLAGNGIGVLSARNTIDSWGGRLQIKSSEGFGTDINIFLGQMKPPKWYYDNSSLN